MGQYRVTAIGSIARREKRRGGLSALALRRPPGGRLPLNVASLVRGHSMGAVFPRRVNHPRDQSTPGIFGGSDVIDTPGPFQGRDPRYGF